MRWLDKLLRLSKNRGPDPGFVEDQTVITGELRMASAERRVAEQKLEQTRSFSAEVHYVASTARRLRTENNFSARWDAAIRKPRNGT